MKNKSLRNWLLIGMISIGTVGVGEVFAGDDEPLTLDNNQLASRKEYKDMKSALKDIEIDKMRIDYHRDQVKVNRGADDVIAKHISKKELRKAKADLRHDKKYLKINKKDLKSDQKVAIKTQRQEEREARKELRTVKWDLQKDLWLGNSTEIERDAKHVDFLSKELEKEKAETLKLEKDVDEFFAYLDTEIEATF